MLDFLFGGVEGTSTREMAVTGQMAADQLPSMARYFEQRIDALSARIADLEKRLETMALRNNAGQNAGDHAEHNQRQVI